MPIQVIPSSPITGIEGIDIAAATELGIVVANGQTRENTESLAEATILLMLAALYDRTGGSLLLVMLLHSAINNTKDIVPSTQTPPPGTFSLKASALSWLTVIVLWAVAIVILRRMKKILTLSTAASSSA